MFARSRYGFSASPMHLFSDRFFHLKQGRKWAGGEDRCCLGRDEEAVPQARETLLRIPMGHPDTDEAVVGALAYEIHRALARYHRKATPWLRYRLRYCASARVRMYTHANRPHTRHTNNHGGQYGRGAYQSNAPEISSRCLYMIRSAGHKSLGRPREEDSGDTPITPSQLLFPPLTPARRPTPPLA